MFYLTYILISFILAVIILENEMRRNPKRIVGGALKRCNVLERAVFYAMPGVSDIYLVLLIIDKKAPHMLPTIDWDNYPKHTVF